MRAFLFNHNMCYLLRSIQFLFLVSSFLNSFVSPTQHFCHPDQRDALLEFKAEFGIQKPSWVDPDFVSPDDSSYPKTKSWVNNSDCCYWDGITCDAKSGEVVGIDLSASCLHGRLESNSSLFRLHQLRDLNLAYNNFTTSPIPAEFDKLKGLKRLNLSDSSFSGQVPTKLLELTKLVSLDLSLFMYSDNSLSVDESFLCLLAQNLRNLEYLDMGFINISSKIPHEFSNMQSLKLLRFKGCRLFGEFPSSVFLIPNLQFIDLSNNKIKGQLPDWLWRLPELSSVFLIPNLQFINLSNNKIKGQLPDWLWRLPELSQLILSNNSFSGFKGSLRALPESKISYLDLSSNTFQGPLFIPSRSIKYFFGSKNNFTGEIPRLICELTSPAILDLSNNNFYGLIPRCLENQMSSLTDLNLRNNSLSGNLPDIFKNAKKLRSLDVSHNQLEGKLPASLTGCSALEILNVESNRIIDMFPFHLNSLKNLQVLVLRSNKFHGMLYQPNGVWFGFPQLKIIDVSHNNFHGVLPSNYFVNWTAISLKTDNTTELNYLGRHSGYYTSLVLMNKGASMEMERILTIYTAIDFLGNQLHGKIPNSIGLLEQLLILNLSSNAFTGHIPSALANLTNLESLDLSQNKISGEIPPELGTLSSLEWINVSHNQLVGSIPQGTQFHRQNCSSYEGNPGIDSNSLKDICGDNHVPTSSQPVESKEEEEEKLFSWVAAGLGLVIGVLFELGIGYKVASDNHEWFMKTLGQSKHQGRRRA